MTSTRRHTIAGPQGELAVSATTPEHPRPGLLPVLMLHSDAGRLEQWDKVVAAIGDSRNVVAFDFRGHGDSAAAADDDYSFAGRADDVAAVVDDVGWDRFVLVAHSGGNGGGLVYAAAHPDRVAGYLAVDPPSDPTAIPEELRQGMLDGMAGTNSLDFVQQYYRTIAGTDPAVVDRVLEETTATGPATRAGLAPALMSWSSALADGYAGPLRVLGSELTDSPGTLARQRPALPSSIVPGTAHWIQLERPDAVVEALGEVDRAIA